MQLTNIARDIGEDAQAGRLYLPLDWFAAVGIDPEEFLAAPAPRPEITAMARRLLDEADRLYQRAQTGIVALPRQCRPGIYAARYIYAGIGRDIAAADYDSVTRRAFTTLSEKIGFVILSLGSSIADSVMPRSAVLHAPPLDETRFLIEAACAGQAKPAEWGEGGLGTLVSVFAQLKQRDLARRVGIDGGDGAVTSG
jgi:phytoene synthase